MRSWNLPNRDHGIRRLQQAASSLPPPPPSGWVQQSVSAYDLRWYRLQRWLARKFREDGAKFDRGMALYDDTFFFYCPKTLSESDNAEIDRLRDKSKADEERRRDRRSVTPEESPEPIGKKDVALQQYGSGFPHLIDHSKASGKEKEPPKQHTLSELKAAVTGETSALPSLARQEPNSHPHISPKTDSAFPHEYESILKSKEKGFSEGDVSTLEPSQEPLEPPLNKWRLETIIRFLIEDAELNDMWRELVQLAGEKEMAQNYIARLLARYTLQLEHLTPCDVDGNRRSGPLLSELGQTMASRIVETYASTLDTTDGNDQSDPHATTSENTPNDGQASYGDLSMSFNAPEVDMRTFLLGGSSFQNLKSNIKIALTRNFEPLASPSWIEKLPISFHNFLDHWRSKLFPEPARTNSQRIRWTCSCGRLIEGDYIELRPGALKSLERRLQNYSRYRLTDTGRPTVIKDPCPSYEGTASILRDKILGFFQWRSNQINHGQEMLPRHRDNTVSIDSAPKIDQGPQTDEAGKSETKANRCLSDDFHSFLLLCIPFMQRGTKAYQPHICTVDSDQEFFKLMGKLYKAERKEYRWSWLKIVDSIHFVKFELLPRGFANVWKDGFLPVGDGYDFDEPETDPPLDSNTLMHFFENPGHASNDLDLFYKFPRKKRDKIGPCPSKRFPHGWGLQFVEILAGKFVFIFGFAGFILSLVAAIAWTTAKDDIQGGFGIGAFLLTFVLFCGTIAHIYIR